MITNEKIEYVMNEASRFFTALNQLREAYPNTSCILSSKYTSAVRRASMDLSRALTELRK